MATTAATNPDGLPAGAPPIALIDSIPSRLAVASGIQTGTLGAATHAIGAPMLAAEGIAAASSDAIQMAIEEAITAAAQTASGVTQTLLSNVDNILSALAADVAANTARKKRCSSTAGGTAGTTGPGLSPPPPPPPLGCSWLLAPAGSGQPDQLICNNPAPVQPLGSSSPAVTATAPQEGVVVPLSGTLVIYTVYINCVSKLLAGVPNVTGTIDRQLRAEGWVPVFPPGTISAQSPADAGALLDSLALQVGPMCPA